MSDDTTERINQYWPKDLKERVKAHAGARGITEFTVAAVEHHLGVAPSVESRVDEINHLKHFIQQLADTVVLGGDQADRLQKLVEIEWPTWIDTQGWPKAYSDLVLAHRAVPESTPPVPQTAAPEPPEAALATVPADGVTVYDESQIVRVPREPKPVHVDETQVFTPEKLVGILQPVTPDAHTVVAQSSGPRTDLLAKVLEATGQDLPVPLKTASQIDRPPPKDAHNHEWSRNEKGDLACGCGAVIDTSDPAYPNGIVREEGYLEEEVPAPTADLCPNEACAAYQKEELIDGECWTCGYVAP